MMHKLSPNSLLLLSPLILTLSCNGYSARESPECSDLPEVAGMRCIPGGPFLMGSNSESKDEDTAKPTRDEMPEHTVTVSTYYMDERETTYSEYQGCVNQGACTKAGPNYRGFSNPAMPMLGANWFQARAYCSWRGKRLPTEAEWERAARGERGELYPWGDDPATCTRAVIEEGGKKGCGTEKTFDTGSKGAFRYGLYDMAGNSWEWVSDWYSKSYEVCGKECSGLDPKGPCGGNDSCPGHDRKIIKGGSWWWSAQYARGANRRPHFPINKPFHHLGFRCAKDAP
jgi:formylglycine-generating enzyme required for sulfatase activity